MKKGKKEKREKHRHEEKIKRGPRPFRTKIRSIFSRSFFNLTLETRKREGLKRVFVMNASKR